ncbi:MAG: hypothetical protein RIG62_00570 [Cyclobacteriaceae bacterium]
MDNRILFSTILLFFSGSSLAQHDSDIIYQEGNDPIACLISDVQVDEIKYKQLEYIDGPDYVINRSKALLLFKRNGDFLLPTDTVNTWVSGASPESHKIIMRNEQIFPAQLIENIGQKITYQHAQVHQQYEIDTEDILLVIYKDGKHELYSSVEDVVKGLSFVSQNMDKYSVPERFGSIEDEMELTESEKAQFEKLAELKANDFGKLLRIITNKKEEENDKIKAIDNACKLFINDSSKVEVSSVNHDQKRRFLVPEYLDRIRYLGYEKVDLQFYKAQLVSKFRKKQDGNYYGIIATKQLFRGYLDNKIAYQDVTEKNIEVVLAYYEVFDDGVKKRKWDVFLSNVTVTQTSEK